MADEQEPNAMDEAIAEVFGPADDDGDAGDATADDGALTVEEALEFVKSKTPEEVAAALREGTAAKREAAQAVARAEATAGLHQQVLEALASLKDAGGRAQADDGGRGEEAPKLDLSDLGELADNPAVQRLAQMVTDGQLQVKQLGQAVTMMMSGQFDREAKETAVAELKAAGLPTTKFWVDTVIARYAQSGDGVKGAPMAPHIQALKQQFKERDATLVGRIRESINKKTAGNASAAKRVSGGGGGTTGIKALGDIDPFANVEESSRLIADAFSTEE